MIIKIAKEAGDFAENKNTAASLRDKRIFPALKAKKTVVLDFTGVRLTTQSFVHALISEVLREYGEDVLQDIEFKCCTKLVRGIVETVVQYSLETVEGDD